MLKTHFVKFKGGDMQSQIGLSFVRIIDLHICNMYRIEKKSCKQYIQAVPPRVFLFYIRMKYIKNDTLVRQLLPLFASVSAKVIMILISHYRYQSVMFTNIH